jgi:hypothetical protein
LLSTDFMAQQSKTPGNRLPTLPAMQAATLQSKPNLVPPRTVMVWIGDSVFRAVLV